jgi:hypothetical protein
MGERLRQQPVGEPGVARQQRPVQVRPEHASRATALEAALTVVAEAREHAPERLRARIELRPARMVLEPGQRSSPSRLELALDQDVADHARLAGDGLEREETDAGHVLAVEAAVAAAEQLVAAADGQDGRAARDRLVQRLRLVREVLGDEQLLAILASADVVEVVRARIDRVVRPDRRHPELVPPPGGPPREHGDVAAVGVDVEVVRIEVPDADRRHRERSQ